MPISCYDMISHVIVSAQITTNGHPIKLSTQPPLLDPKRARIHVPGLKNNPLFHEFGRQKVPLFLTNREFS